MHRFFYFLHNFYSPVSHLNISISPVIFIYCPFDISFVLKTSDSSRYCRWKYICLFSKFRNSYLSIFALIYNIVHRPKISTADIWHHLTNPQFMKLIHSLKKFLKFIIHHLTSSKK